MMVQGGSLDVEVSRGKESVQVEVVDDRRRSQASSPRVAIKTSSTPSCKLRCSKPGSYVHLWVLSFTGLHALLTHLHLWWCWCWWCWCDKVDRQAETELFGRRDSGLNTLHEITTPVPLPLFYSPSVMGMRAAAGACWKKQNQLMVVDWE